MSLQFGRLYDAADALGRSQLFHDLPAEMLQELASVAHRRSYRRGETVVRQGEPGDALYVLMDGEVKVMVEAPSGENAVVALLGPGDCAGEFSLIDGQPRSATVEAMDDVEVLVLLRRDFLDFIQSHREAMERLLVTLVTRLRRTDQLAAELARLDTRGRLAKTLLDLAREHGKSKASEPGTEIELPITQGDLAAMVGATRERVNRLLSTLEDDGAIHRHGRHIVVLDPQILRERIA